MAKRAGKITPMFVWKDAGNGRSYMETDMGHQFYHTDEKGSVKAPSIHNDADRDFRQWQGQRFVEWSREQCEQDYKDRVRSLEEIYVRDLDNRLFNPVFGEELNTGDYSHCDHVRLSPQTGQHYGFEDLAIQSPYFSQLWAASVGVKEKLPVWFEGENVCGRVENGMDFITSDIEETLCPGYDNEDYMDAAEEILDNGGCIHLGFEQATAIRVDIPLGTISHVNDGKVGETIDNRRVSRPTNEQKMQAEEAHNEIIKALHEAEPIRFESDYMRKHGDYFKQVLGIDPASGRHIHTGTPAVEEEAEMEASTEKEDDSFGMGS